ncbi:MAG: ectoine hydroxylase-related dioxygenase (phytanoyl-CoA dioxygenase family) [Planctomycetota bacterium]|jgi:ectoine hydroxylase-related dioxygenase (phytanoyl-CoA dioxygenase family)
MVDITSSLESGGFCVVADVVDRTMIANLRSELDQLGAVVGARDLLKHSLFQDLAMQLRSHSELSPALSELGAIQCTSFTKTAERNWSVRTHQDRVIPMTGERQWKTVATKEGMPFVRPDPAFMSQLVAVRINLDDATEGDLEVMEASHHGELTPVRSQLTRVHVGEGGVLLMKPLLFHASSKLKMSKKRRVIHVVFGPKALPDGHNWVHCL